MNEKEKAVYLIGLFYGVCGLYTKSKKCAILCVDEIIESSPSAPILSEAGSFVNDIEESTGWWKNVKKELEKM